MTFASAALASRQITAADSIISELARTTETPEAILIHRPAAPERDHARPAQSLLTRSSGFWRQPGVQLAAVRVGEL